MAWWNESCNYTNEMVNYESKRQERKENTMDEVKNTVKTTSDNKEAKFEMIVEPSGVTLRGEWASRRRNNSNFRLHDYFLTRFPQTLLTFDEDYYLQKEWQFDTETEALEFLKRISKELKSKDYSISAMRYQTRIEESIIET
jgi:hypothetical protein